MKSQNNLQSDKEQSVNEKKENHFMKKLLNKILGPIRFF